MERPEELYLKDLTKMQDELNYEEIIPVFRALLDNALIFIQETRDQFFNWVLGEIDRTYKQFSKEKEPLDKFLTDVVSGKILTLGRFDSLREEGLKAYILIKYIKDAHKALKEVYKEMIVEPLVRSVGPLAIKLCRDQFKNATIPFTERVSLAMEGVVKAAWRFEPDSGYKFTTYALQWIRSVIVSNFDGYSAVKIGSDKDAFFQLGGLYHQFQKETGEVDIDLFFEWLEKEKGKRIEEKQKERAKEIFLALKTASIDDVFSNEDMENRTTDDYLSSALAFADSSFHKQPEEIVGKIEWVERFQDALDNILTPREKEIFLKIVLGDKTQGEVADELRVSRQSVSQLYRNALTKIRTAFPNKEAFLNLSCPNTDIL